MNENVTYQLENDAQDIIRCRISVNANNNDSNDECFNWNMDELTPTGRLSLYFPGYVISTFRSMRLSPVATHLVKMAFVRIQLEEKPERTAVS